ncbi:hypothetical protein AAG570_008356 [Ranatra chinensis]|uniref:Galactose mutarotase n=1 Tax=Ranatra chinensis TaxID=642074 RepID=A0ABD0YEP8_9HEMI
MISKFLLGYLREDNPYFGATVGRVANRITNGTFVIDQKRYFVTRNIGPHTIHGGKYGFDKKIWNAKILSGSVIMTLESKDNDEGFPGDLFTEITYTLTENNELVIVFKSHTNQPTPVNIVNHSYFNLAGHDKGAEGLYEHEVVINADKYTPLSKEFSLPTGEIKSVDTTEFDLRNKTILGDSIKKTSNGDGFDINLIVNGEGYRQFSKVAHPQSGRYMTVYSDQPGVQFYTSNFLNNVIGKDGQVYNKHAGLCLETQQFPDAVNHVS